MRVRLPVSRASFSVRLSRFDLVCAILAPWLSLWVRGAQVLNSDPVAAATYCAIAFLASAIAFIVFRIRDGLTHLFSVHDALEVAKAVLLAEALTFLILFSATRLEGIPRSTPVIHALVLGAALVCGRAFVRMFYRELSLPEKQSRTEPEYTIVIGSNKLAALYIEMLRAYSARHAVVGVLDDRPETIGRSTAGVKVLGPTSHLCQLVQEYLDHGIHVQRVLVGFDSDKLGDELRGELHAVGTQHSVQVAFIPDLVGLRDLHSGLPRTDAPPAPIAIQFAPARRYFVFKRYIDFVISLALIILLTPFFVLTAFLVLMDIGSPVFFWQRRIGMHGRSFQLHKYRTLKPSFDENALAISNASRLSSIGRFLRNSRLDELPQLLNVLVGDMSIIGPRPLLPEDQPTNPSVRLSVRPGITGWAQVNGGKLLDAESKNALDEWYVRNASLWLDLNILFRTILVMLRGERLNDGQKTASSDIDDMDQKYSSDAAPEELQFPAQ